MISLETLVRTSLAANVLLVSILAYLAICNPGFLSSNNGNAGASTSDLGLAHRQPRHTEQGVSTTQSARTVSPAMLQWDGHSSTVAGSTDHFVGRIDVPLLLAKQLVFRPPDPRADNAVRLLEFQFDPSKFLSGFDFSKAESKRVSDLVQPILDDYRNLLIGGFGESVSDGESIARTASISRDEMSKIRIRIADALISALGDIDGGAIADVILGAVGEANSECNFSFVLETEIESDRAAILIFDQGGNQIHGSPLTSEADFAHSIAGLVFARGLNQSGSQ